MVLGKKLIIVLPAYNAAQTVEQTYSEIPLISWTRWYLSTIKAAMIR